MPEPSIKLQQFAEELLKFKSAIVCTHVSPDIDAVGSASALALGLLSIGCDAVVYLPEKLPERFVGLVRNVPIIQSISSLPQAEIVVSVDAATKSRIGGYKEGLFEVVRPFFNIDHHVSNPGFADFNCVRGDAAACSMLVYELLGLIGAPISRDIANLLYAGLLDDTGCFRYSNTDAASLCCGAELAAHGALPQDVANQLYYSMPERMLKLQGFALETLELHFGGRVSFLCVSQEMFERAQATAEDSEGIVDLARSISGVELAIFMRELSNGWKVSLRSKNENIDANAICSYFGGGGHKAASGCKIECSLAEAKEKLFSKIAEVLEGLSRT